MRWSVPDVTRLHLAYRARLDRLRAAVVARALAAEDPDAAVLLVLAAQRQVVADVDAYMSMEAGLATGTSTEPWGLNADPLIGHNARRGTFLEDVYGRNWVAAASSFESRITREVNTDITLADRGAGFVHTEGDSRIVGTRRVLGSGPNCGLCVAAATRAYFKRDLRPIHQHCGCTTQPIYSLKDPESWTKPTNEALNNLYARAGGTDKKSLGRIVVADADLPPGVKPGVLHPVEIIDTPELGPTLVAA
jgi:hypothetical protein